MSCVADPEPGKHSFWSWSIRFSWSGSSNVERIRIFNTGCSDWGYVVRVGGKAPAIIGWIALQFSLKLETGEPPFYTFPWILCSALFWLVFHLVLFLGSSEEVVVDSKLNVSYGVPTKIFFINAYDTLVTRLPGLWARWFDYRQYNMRLCAGFRSPSGRNFLAKRSP